VARHRRNRDLRRDLQLRGVLPDALRLQHRHKGRQATDGERDHRQDSVAVHGAGSVRDRRHDQLSRERIDAACHYDGGIHDRASDRSVRPDRSGPADLCRDHDYLPDPEKGQDAHHRRDPRHGPGRTRLRRAGNSCVTCVKSGLMI